MRLRVTCPDCARDYSLREGAGGKRFRCGDCGCVITVAHAAEGPSPAADRPLRCRPPVRRKAARPRTLSADVPIGTIVGYSLLFAIILGCLIYICLLLNWYPYRPQDFAILAGAVLVIGAIYGMHSALRDQAQVLFIGISLLFFLTVLYRLDITWKPMLCLLGGILLIFIGGQLQ